MSEAALFELFTGIPRQGPGSAASTLTALRRLPPLPRDPRVLDLGCGTGSQTLVLARELGGLVTGVDIHQPFLDELLKAAIVEGLSPNVEIRRASMDALDDPPESVDLIWSEGAIYLVGVSRALALWKPLLKTGGALAFTELSWLGPERPEEARGFWAEAYPRMDDVPGNLAKARSAGFEPIDHFTLPGEDWWAELYTPLRERCRHLSAECDPGSGLAAVIRETEREIELFDRHGDAYGYVFYVLRKPS